MCSPMRLCMKSLLVVIALASAAGADGFIIIERPIILPRPTPVPPRVAHFPLEVKKHTVACTIRDTVAVTKVDQTFHNPNAQQMEGTYMFPLPETASVQKFSMWMDGKEVKGEILDAEKARSTYEDIVRKMRDPALLEYVGSRLYKARVFPIPANGDVRIALEYTETLTADNGLSTYRYPLNTEKFSASDIEEVVVVVDLNSKVPLKNVFCTSHTATVSRPNDREARVAYEAKKVKPDRDFVVHYQVSDKEFGLSLLTYRPPGEEGFFMARLSPPSGEEKIAAIPKDVCFVVDTSGSMAGAKIEQAKKALKFCVASLRAQDRFNLIPFATEPRPFRDTLVQATPENLQAAQAEIERIEAAGGTDIHGALATALQSRPKTEANRPYMIVFMTDGQPTIGETDPAKIQADIKKANDAATRLFVFGVGTDLNVTLLDRLAEDNRGAREYIDDKEDIEVKVSSFFRKVADPVLSAIELRFGDAGTTETYPKQLPDLFHGSELVIVGRYRTGGSHTVALSGKRADASPSWTFTGSFVDTTSENDFLPRLWATRKIGYLLDEIRLRGETKEVKDEVVRLAKRYAIVTPYTSYLVVEDAKSSPVAAGTPARPGTPMYRMFDTWEAESGGDLGFGHSVGRPAVRGSMEAKMLQRAGDPATADESLTLGDAVISLKSEDGDGRSEEASGSVKAIGDKVFYLHDGRWTDGTYDGKAVTSKLKAFSGEYFELVKKIPQLRRYLALGQRVLVVYAGTVYETIE